MFCCCLSACFFVCLFAVGFVCLFVCFLTFLRQCLVVAPYFCCPGRSKTCIVTDWKETVTVN